jgi:hypothetical protein
MTYHFYVAFSENDVRPLSAAFLPRVGDTIHVDGIDRKIDKVTWFTNGGRVEDMPLMNLAAAPNVITDHHIATTDTLALQIAKQSVRYEGNNTTGKIQAIKEYRAQTNVGLREAKEAIDEAWHFLETKTSP